MQANGPSVHEKQRQARLIYSFNYLIFTGAGAY